MSTPGDLWALGVVCFILVSGKVPFRGEDQMETLRQIKQTKLSWPSTVTLSASCKDFIQGLLCKDVSQRMDCAAALQHEWIADKAKARSVSLGEGYLENVRLFTRANQLQRIMLNAVLREMKQKEQRVLLKALRALDLERDAQKGSSTGRESKIYRDDVINYVLLHGQMDGDGLKLKFNDNYAELDSMTHLSLHGIHHDIDGILEEIEEEESVCDVEGYEDEDKEDDGEDLIFELDEDDDEDEDEDEDFEAVARHKLNFYNFSSNQSSETDFGGSVEAFNMIAVDKFAGIMELAEKDYDVQSLVEQLQPTECGHIPLSHIMEYSGPLHLRHSLALQQKQMEMQRLGHQ